MASQNKEKGRIYWVRKFLRSRPSHLPELGEFEIRSKKDENNQKLLKLEELTKEQLNNLLDVNEALVKQMKALLGHIDDKMCELYWCWEQLNRNLRR